MASQLGSRRGGVIAAAFAAVIIVGSLTGAQLKQDKQKQESIKQFRETRPSEQIAMLESRKQVLQKERADIQLKLDKFRAKVKVREEEERQKQSEKPT